LFVHLSAVKAEFGKFAELAIIDVCLRSTEEVAEYTFSVRHNQTGVSQLKLDPIEDGLIKVAGHICSEEEISLDNIPVEAER
jgi:hypothetical protein